MPIKEKSRWPEGLMIALFTLLGAFITSCTTYLSAMQAAAVNSRQSCISRIDTREIEIRQKSERFLVSLASVVNLSTHASLDLKKTEEASDEMMKAGYALSGYVDDELADYTRLLVLQLSTRLDMSSSRITNPESQKALAADSRESLNSWNASFREQLTNLENKRKDC